MVKKNIFADGLIYEKENYRKMLRSSKSSYIFEVKNGGYAEACVYYNYSHGDIFKPLVAFTSSKIILAHEFLDYSISPEVSYSTLMRQRRNIVIHISTRLTVVEALKRISSRILTLDI